VTAINLALSGSAAGNYTANTTATTTADISAKGLTISGLAAADKVYDATTAATLTGGALIGTIHGDDVSLAVGNGAFADKNVGADKAVTVSGTSLSGADAGNYSVTVPGGLNASITPKGLTLAADDQAKLIGTADPALTYRTIGEGLLGSDTLAGALTRVPGETVAGSPYAITQGSLANSNYAIAFNNGILTINPAAGVVPPAVVVVPPPAVVTPPPVVVTPPPVVVTPPPVVVTPPVVVDPSPMLLAIMPVSPLLDDQGKEDNFLLVSYPSYRVDMRNEAISDQTLTKSLYEVQNGGINLPKRGIVERGY